MREALLRWFDGSARPFPWRAGPREPYVTWIVETMSQQTRIETVLACLPAFLARFPTVEALAGAEVGDVLAAWSGLGYYRRAQGLHAAARVVVGELGGRWPTGVDGWARLPGVGPYTAAAVAAQAFGVATIAVDGNVRRVGARLLGEPVPDDRRLRDALAARLLPEGGRTRGPGAEPAGGGGTAEASAARVAEALVELGALVCTPRAPRCEACPLRHGCAAAASGDPTRFPTPRRRARVERLELHAWIVTRPSPGGGERVALERRPPDGLWGGLHGPPWRDAPPAAGARLGAFRHALTHRRVEAVVWRAAAPPPGAEVRWVEPHETAALGLGAVDRRALGYLERPATLGR